MRDLVRTGTGVPTETDFTAKNGSPVVFDDTPVTGGGYWIDSGNNIRRIGDVQDGLVVNGLLDISAAGAGQIKFPATQNASTNANTLDDYAEATTTPTPVPASGAFTTATAVVRTTKIGNRVLYTATVVITTNGTAAAYIVVPMPFTAAETTGSHGSITATGVSCSGFVTGANLGIWTYAGTYPGADGVIITMNGNYRV